VRRERHAADAHAGGVEDRVGDRGRHRPDRRLAGTGGWQLGMVDQHHLNRLRRLGDVEDRVGHPVDAGHVLSVELDLLPQRAADALNNVAFDRMRQTIGIDDLATVVGDRELARPDFPGLPVDFDLRYHSDARAVALRIGDAAARDLVAGLILARRGSRLPARLFSGGLDHRDVARVLDVTQAEFDGVEVERRRQLVHERLAGEMDLRSDRIAQMRAAQRGAALEQRRNGLPRQALVGELVGLGGDAEAVGGFELGAAQLARQRVLGRAAVGVHVDAREAFAGELVADDVAGRVDGGAGAVDGSGTFGIPSRRLLARILHAHRFADRIGQHRGIHRRVVGVAAAVGAGADHPDRAHLLRRNAERERDAVAHEMRLLRAGPAGHVAVLDLHYGASWPHAGVGLERPFVFGLDHTRRALERVVDVAGFLAADLALAHGGAANVVVERGLIGEWGLGVRPFHLERLRRVDRVPFLVGDDAEEALLPHHLGAGDVLDRAFVDLDRHAARDGGPDQPAMHQARGLDVGAEIFLRVDLGRDVLARDRLADDLVTLGILRLCLARGVEGVAILLVPIELDVEIAPADQLGVGRFLARIVLGVHHAVGDGERVGREPELRRRHLDEHAARLGRGHAHLLAAHLDAGRARGTALVHAGGGIAHDYGDGLERHVELFRHHLADGDEQA